MKKRNNPILYILFSIALVIASCGEITEEIYLNEDGSGSYMMYTDMIGSTRQMMMDMMQGIYPDMDEDSLRQMVEENLWKDFPNEVDSLIDLAAQVPDSIKQDPEKMEMLSSIEMFMKGSKELGYINMGARFDFENMEELEKFQSFLAENQSTNAGPGASVDAPKFDVDYSFDGKTFSRTSTLREESKNMSDSTLAMLGVMLAETTSRTIIHLPSKAKKVSKEYLVSNEGDVIIYEYSVMETITGEQSSNFKIQMK